MEPKTFYVILSIVGFFGTTGLMINAYFFKQFNDNLMKVNLGLAKLFAREEERDKKLEDHEARIRNLESGE